MCIVHTTQDVSAQGLKRTTPRTHACQVKVQKKKSTTLNFGDLVDHPPLHPGYLHKMFYPLTASFSLSPSSCPPGSAWSIPSLTSFGPGTCQSVSKRRYCTKISKPSLQTNFLANIGFFNRITFWSFFSQFLPDHLLLFLFVFRPPGPLPKQCLINMLRTTSHLSYKSSC